jgi:hypothetical protein
MFIHRAKLRVTLMDEKIMWKFCYTPSTIYIMGMFNKAGEITVISVSLRKILDRW